MTLLPLLVTVAVLPMPASVDVARTTWGTPPCGEPALVLEAAPPGDDALAWVMAIDRGAGPVPADCDIHVRWPNPAPELLCEQVVHEWGHLAGHAHSTDPTSVMYPQATYIPQCHPQATRWVGVRTWDAMSAGMSAFGATTIPDIVEVDA